jgi:pteridine reductase
MTPSSAPPRPHALVTGGARRVGRAIALAFAKAGCDVSITFATSDSDAQETRARISDFGVQAHAFKLHLDDDAALLSFPAQLAAHHPTLDILVHNASSYTPSPLTSLSSDQIRRDYQVNALAPLILSATLAPLLATSALPGGGSIVAMADLHAMGRPRKDFASYSMSKAALVEMVHSLARDLAPSVRVNGVAPGVVAWPDTGAESQPAAQAAYFSRVPLKRAGTPEDAAEVVRWLALDAHYVTGEIIRVDGGRWLA